MDSVDSPQDPHSADSDILPTVMNLNEATPNLKVPVEINMAERDMPEGEPTADQIVVPANWRVRPADMISDLLRSLATPSNRPGSLGRIQSYDILGVIGQGAMGVVLRAFDESLQRMVAIKFLSPHLLTSPSAKERFRREARSAAGISHPNVVTIHAVSEIESIPFLVMEYIDGQSLSERIHSKQAEPLEVLDVMRIAQQMAAGLAAAHRQGIVHRDIKPSNIMLEESIERVRIADFGLARVAMDQSSLTSDGQIVGTPSYMSPEQVNCEQLDPRSDLFSVGCVIYAMLTGHSPFEAPNGLAAARAIQTKEPVPLKTVCERAPLFLCEIVHRLLEKDRAKRFQSADELARELTRHIRTWGSISDVPVLTRPVFWTVPRIAAIIVTTAAIIVAVALVIPYLKPSPVHSGQPIESTSAAAVQNEGSANPVAARAPSIAAPLKTIPAANGRLTVARDGSARCVTLADAIAAAQPNTVIELLDEGPYAGAISINEPNRLRGLKIVGRSSIITAPTQQIIQIAGVADVSIEGLILNVSGTQHGFDVTGDCPGLSIRDSILQPIPPSWPAISFIYLHQAASGTVEKPIEFRNLDIKFGAVGFVLGEPDSPGPVRHVRITDCKIVCPDGRIGTSMILFDGLQDIQISRNLLETGGAALSLNLEKTQSVQEFDFSWNTLSAFDHSILPNASVLSQQIQFHNNLLLDVGPPLILLENVDLIAPWHAGNVWVGRADANGIIERLGERRDQIPLLDTSPYSQNYLVPTNLDIRAGRRAKRPTTESSNQPK